MQALCCPVALVCSPWDGEMWISSPQAATSGALNNVGAPTKYSLGSQPPANGWRITQWSAIEPLLLLV